jgi:hypothetical protein
MTFATEGSCALGIFFTHPTIPDNSYEGIAETRELSPGITP